MSTLVAETMRMLEMLPETDQKFANEFVKKLVKAWDPDYTKVTPAERKAIEEAEKGEFISEEDIDWDHLEKYASI